MHALAVHYHCHLSAWSGYKQQFWHLPQHVALLQGMLAIGAALLGSGHVIGVDVDSDALELALDNSLEFENLEVRWLQCRP